MWHIVTGVAGITALFTNYWLDPKNGAQLYIPVQSAGLWQVCGPGNMASKVSVGSVMQELQTVGDEFADIDSWVFGKGCSRLYGDEVVKFYSNIPVGPNGDDYWVWIQATGGLAVAFCVLCLIMIPVVASHSSYRTGCEASGWAHFLAFLQAGTGFAAVSIFVSVVARIASKKIWSDFDPSSLIPDSLNSTIAAAAAAALAGGDDYGDYGDYGGGLDLSDVSGLPNDIAAATINQGWSTTGNYWGWSFWVFVGATGLAILGWPLLCFALCCSVGRPAGPVHRRSSY